MDSVKKTILARSSSGDSYEVQFLLELTSVRVFCHCPAGEVQQMCKHKLALIKGDLAMLFDAAQEEDLKQILAWPSFVKLQARLTRYESELLAIEKEKTMLGKREKETKSHFARELTLGIS